MLANTVLFTILIIILLIMLITILLVILLLILTINHNIDHNIDHTLNIYQCIIQNNNKYIIFLVTQYTILIINVLQEGHELLQKA